MLKHIQWPQPPEGKHLNNFNLDAVTCPTQKISCFEDQKKKTSTAESQQNPHPPDQTRATPKKRNKTFGDAADKSVDPKTTYQEHCNFGDMLYDSSVINCL